MRIIIIHTFYKNVGGGEDIVFDNESDLLRKNGHQVEKLVYTNESIKGPLSKFAYLFRSIYNPRSAAVLTKRIKEFKPDLIHVHNTFFVASPSIFIVAKKYNIPVVQTLHNYRLICPSATLYHNGRVYMKSVKKLFPIEAIFKKLYRNSFLETALIILITAIHKLKGTYRNCVDRYIVLNKFSIPIFKNSSLNIREDQMVVKPNFVEDPKVESATRGDYFVFVGRLTEEKGILTVLSAFENTSAKLKIFGGGDLESEVRNRSSKHENIEFLGYQSRDKLMSAISKARALIFPSEWLETFGLTIIEAFSVGTPVLVSDLGGHSELVEEGKTGIHFKCGDPEDLNKKLELFQDLEEVKKMGKNAREVFIQKYRPEVNYEYLMNIYQDLVNK